MSTLLNSQTVNFLLMFFTEFCKFGIWVFLIIKVILNKAMIYHIEKKFSENKFSKALIKEIEDELNWHYTVLFLLVTVWLTGLKFIMSGVFI